MGMRALKLKLGNHRAPNDPVTSTKKLKDIKIEREGWRIFGLKETEGIWQSVAIYCPQWDFESDKDTVKRKEQIPGGNVSTLSHDTKEVCTVQRHAEVVLMEW